MEREKKTSMVSNVARLEEALAALEQATTDTLRSFAPGGALVDERYLAVAHGAYGFETMVRSVSSLRGLRWEIMASGLRGRLFCSVDNVSDPSECVGEVFSKRMADEFGHVAVAVDRRGADGHIHEPVLVVLTGCLEVNDVEREACSG